MIDCPQCQGDMGARNPPRMGGGMGALGIVLLICSISGILVGLTMWMLGAASAELDTDWTEIEHEFALAQLEQLDDVPYAVCEEFRRDQDISAKSLAGLPPEVREEVEGVLSHFRESAEDPLPNPFSNMNSYGSTVLLAAVPTLLLGILFARKRKIWLCLDCGYQFDR